MEKRVKIWRKSTAAAKTLARRTLTALYNEAPDWLTEVHRALDEAVATAGGWPVSISDDDALSNLLNLNLRRHACEKTG